MENYHDEELPPPQPMDTPATRPPLDLANVWSQVAAINENLKRKREEHGRTTSKAAQQK